MVCMPAFWATPCLMERDRSRRISKMPTCTASRNIVPQGPYEVSARALSHGSCRFLGTRAPLQLSGDTCGGAVPRLQRCRRKALDWCRQWLPRCVQLGVDRRPHGFLLLDILMGDN